ncbi:uncharacterized protein LOC129779958 [Toxorhynchites rutilus septentrionalis]|uniref:uncharacterized protein LOC129779958 n=1 Tax=Toxorhynchites rutilus septentrionalis TaxID=329112 RepID=UPI00247AE534|nr:uncharacterized protein LOC129779958 [Toxorhynchites rutilus septentrionalis]
MVRKNTKRNKKKNVAKTTDSDIFDNMLGSEVSPEYNIPSRSPPAQEFSILTGSQTPTSALNVQSMAVVVDGNTVTVPYTAESTIENANDETSLSRSSVCDNVDYQNETPLVSNASKTNVSKRKTTTVARRSAVETGSKALREIAKYQSNGDLLFPKLPFARLIREILLEYSCMDLRITSESLLCLQEAAEIYGVQLMEDAFRCTIHRDRQTLMPKDMRLALMLRKDSVMY